MTKGNGIINIELFNEDELRNSRVRYGMLVREFNRIHDMMPDRIDEMSYMDFHKHSGERLRPEEWLEFMSDYRVSQVLDKIMLIKMRSNINKLSRDGENKSVAASQKLSASLNFMDKHFTNVMDSGSTVYVYTSVPLTENEERARNAKTLVVRPNVNPHNPANPGSENFNRRMRNENK